MNKSLLAFSFVLLFAGCASERVVLLPSPDGRQTAVVIRDADRELVLDKPYAGSRRLGSANDAYQTTAEEVQARFGAALAARPPRPSSYFLYFEEGSNVLTADSQAEFARMRAEILTRPAVEIAVIGHTDSVGSAQGNDALSKQRAEAISAMLVEAGVPAEKLEAVGRGERELLVPTADEVAEPKNRRVEISLR